MKYTPVGIGFMGLHFYLLLPLLFRGKDAPPYSLKTPFPNKTYNDLNSTLSENNLTPNATLHIVPRKL